MNRISARFPIFISPPCSIISDHTFIFRFLITCFTMDTRQSLLACLLFQQNGISLCLLNKSQICWCYHLLLFLLIDHCWHFVLIKCCSWFKYQFSDVTSSHWKYTVKETENQHWKSIKNPRSSHIYAINFPLFTIINCFHSFFSYSIIKICCCCCCLTF